MIEVEGAHTKGCGEQSRVLIVDAQANREDREYIEDDDAEERRPDRARDGLVWARALARGK